ncbi:MAG TPA: hypothetical protein VMZ31_00410 [Phycisphaerae bacterium]|nr:hypothetical protein [Phycisphaerae bacterium]
MTAETDESARDPRWLGRARLRGTELLPWLFVLVGFVAFQWSSHGWLYAASDDSYIYLGYVKRALTAPHSLFSYNPGEYSGGTTGVLYYYLLIAVCGIARSLTWPLGIELSLLLGLYATNAALFLLTAHRYLRCWRALTGESDRIGFLKLCTLFLLFCAHPQFLWGVFAGMENPLAAFLVLLLLDWLVRRQPFWRTVLLAALLCATRPELTIVLFTIPIVGVLADARSRALRQPNAKGGRWGLVRRILAAYGIWAACLGALIFPCYLTTGRLFPSALGTRVVLPPLGSFSALMGRLQAMFGWSRYYWASEWLLLAYVSPVAALLFGLARRRWALLWVSFYPLAFFLLRAFLQLHDFNVEDRYVSYLWPLYAVILASWGNTVWQYMSRYFQRSGRLIGSLVGIGVLVVAVLFPIREFLHRFDKHVGLMNTIVVEPSRWMRDNLPPTARVCMEPAGAIRVFTDFYLVDAVGLTTTHRRSYQGNYLDFLHDHRVEYVFDRPPATVALLTAGVGRDLKVWAEGVKPWGDIHLYKVEPFRGVVISRVASSGTRSRSGPLWAFDNNLAPRDGRWQYWFAAHHGPAWIQAEFERPIGVDAFALVIQSPSVKGAGAPGQRSMDIQMEGKIDGAWADLDCRSKGARTVGDGREFWMLILAAPVELEGIRSRLSSGDSRTPPVVYEIVSFYERRPYVWLWPDRTGGDPG